MEKLPFVAIAMFTATLLVSTSCHKPFPDQSFVSPWKLKSSGITTPQAMIIEMAAPDQITCYGLVTDGNYTPSNDIVITHDGGASWQMRTIAELKGNYDFGLAASDISTVHVVGYDYKKGGGNVFRSVDGGITWEREAANAYVDAASFPDAIKFFDAEHGVIFGDVLNGSFEIYTTSDRGNNWKRVPAANIPAPLANEYGSAYVNDTYKNTMWMVTDIAENNNVAGGRLLQSDDKGKTWYVKNPSMTKTGFDGSIKFRNQSVGLYKNNGVLYRTTNGGTTWDAVNYSGNWFSFDLDNVPGLDGTWISTGGGPESPNTVKGKGSSKSFDDGNTWITLDTLDHTCVEMTNPIHGYSGGITRAEGKDGVFVYAPLPVHSLLSYSIRTNILPLR